MNKLRELIEANKARAFGYAKEPLDRWVREHLEDIVDVIESARHLVAACTTGITGASGEPMGVRVPSKVDVDQLREALTKLENDK
jgi:hypothetical protein